MNEEALRALVRESIARHLGGEPSLPVRGEMTSPAPVASQASFYRYALPESDGPCVIEPNVRCDHCGYCQSHGH